ncbi:olfactory receptor 4S1-like [Gracilinanus agilis]|uniref:olfactory receptor 4S1-like n=1 Tax=Gracilinanus agilis TaxID=191870 RepID=UPI001CFC6795|nr:olfactory receptor 4S1-like [Gracilinanus agilis]
MEDARNVTEFIFLGILQGWKMQRVAFGFFLVLYVLTIVGNLLIVVTVNFSGHLTSPMYFFLSYLSFVDVCYSSTTTPKMMADLFIERKTISFNGCMTQLFAVHFFGCTEIYLLTVMAYDRYVAICRPLHYTVIMNRRVCRTLVLALWVGAFLHSIIQTLLTIQLPFCGPNVIDHYFCDVHPLLKLACSDTYVVGLIVVANSGMISLIAFFCLVISYSVILFTLRTQSAEGRRKALSTCGSHVVAVLLFFVPCIYMYIRPTTTLAADKLVTLFNTVMPPMLNPLIYTLRNAEVKKATRKLWSQKVILREK